MTMSQNDPGSSEDLSARIAKLEATQTRNRKALRLATAAAVLLAAPYAWAQVQSACVQNKTLCAFSAGTLARADEINNNFTVLKGWIEQKTGSLTRSDLTFGATTGPYLRLDPDELEARNGAAAGTLTLQSTGGSLTVGGSTTIKQNLVIEGDLTVKKSATVTGALSAGPLTASGVITGGGYVLCDQVSAIAYGCGVWGSAGCNNSAACGARLTCPAETTRLTTSGTVQCYGRCPNEGWNCACFQYVCQH